MLGVFFFFIVLIANIILYNITLMVFKETMLQMHVLTVA